MVSVYPDVVNRATFAEHARELKSLRFIFSTWGMPALTPEQLALLPNLEVVFYAAGSVKAFAEPFLKRGVRVVSAWAANAVPVAEFTVAQILLANKGYFRNVRDAARPQTRPQAFAGPGNFGVTVALLGAGMIGKEVRRLLKAFQLDVVVFDPFLPDVAAARLQVEKVSLEDAFKRGQVVSNHLANVPETRGLLRREHFAAMRPNAVFINTGRGATVVEDDLAAVLRERPDLTALLDVTDPEPPAPTSSFYTLPNVLLSSHIAGSVNGEVVRMADTVIEEFAALTAGKPLKYAVTLDMLPKMA